MGLCLEAACKLKIWKMPTKQFERTAKHHKRP